MIKACQSLTSRNYLKTQFSWQWYYYTLTPEGLDYLREWLHVPADIVPATHIKQARSHAPPRGMMSGEDRDRRGGSGMPGGRGRGEGGFRGGDREGGYRRREMGDGKEGGAPGEFAPQLYVFPPIPRKYNCSVASTSLDIYLLPGNLEHGLLTRRGTLIPTLITAAAVLVVDGVPRTLLSLLQLPRKIPSSLRKSRSG